MDLHQQLKYFYQQQRNQSFAGGLLEKEAGRCKKMEAEAASIKTTTNSQAQQTILNNQTIGQLQRKIFAFIYLYAIVIVSLYLTYACYYFYQHHSRQTSNSFQSEPEVTIARSSAQQLTANADELQESKLETKMHLLERYIELIALDLQETKSRLREREKCDCPISCTFNNTNFADNSSWQSQCDICTCKAGKISCAPQKCPAANCDVASQVTLPGQCCPSCMKTCKHNNKTYQHGHKFLVPAKPDNKLPIKECKCDDGRIKCEQRSSSQKLKESLLARPAPNSAGSGQVSNKSTSGKVEQKR